jgi:hypothetical protein
MTARFWSRKLDELKLRILNQTVRFRLQKSEVVHLAEHGEISATSRLAGRELTCRVSGGESADPQLSWDGTSLALTVPVESLRTWARGDEVGYGRIPVDFRLASASLRST